MAKNDCPKCGHHASSHNTGRCNVLQSAHLGGVDDFRPDGCGCTALAFDMTCPTCGKLFVCAQQGHEQHDCLSCYEVKKANADEQSFGPLIEALNERNIPVSAADIWNTGGNVMCLALHLTEDPKGPYVMWSDGAEWIGFGVYPDDEHTGFNVSPMGDEGERSDDSWSWAYGDNAERAADLAARAIPQVVRWLDEQRFTTREESSSFGPYTLREIVRPYTALVVTDAQVEDFEAPR